MFVVFNHALPLYIKKDILYNLWGGLGVPIFLLLQSFHYYKRGLGNSKPFNFMGFFKKMFLPFLIAELLIVIIRGLLEGDILGFARSVLLSCGTGPGDHYIWIFLQFVVLLPICAQIFMRVKGVFLPILMVLISVALEILCSYWHIADRPYNFLFFRYFFLIYLGYIWASEGIVLTRFRLFLSIVSIVCIILFDYTEIDFSPIIFKTTRRTNHWICYFYVAFMFPFLLRWINDHIWARLRKMIMFCGKMSWLIFCSQIVVFSFWSPSVFTFTENVLIRNLLYLFSAILMSIIPSILISLCKKKLMKG